MWYSKNAVDCAALHTSLNSALSLKLFLLLMLGWRIASCISSSSDMLIYIDLVAVALLNPSWYWRWWWMLYLAFLLLSSITAVATVLIYNARSIQQHQIILVDDDEGRARSIAASK